MSSLRPPTSVEHIAKRGRVPHRELTKHSSEAQSPPTTHSLHLCPIPNLHRHIQLHIINTLIPLQDLPHNRLIALSKLTHRRPLSHIPATHTHRHSPRRNIDAMDRAIEQHQREHGLVEGDFVSGVVDAREREVIGLLHLAVRDVVGRLDVGVAGGGEERRVEEVGGDGLAAEPVAYVV